RPSADKPSGKDVVKVGAVLPLSGQTATYGEEALAGIKLALKELNAKDGPKMELVFKDNKGDSTETAKLVSQLIKVDKVNAILGSVASTNTLKGAKVAQEAGIPLMTPASTNVDITRKGDFISRVCFIDPVQGSVLAKLVLEDLSKKKAAIIVDKASDYSVGLAKSFRSTFTGGGGEVVGEESFTAGEADFSALITKVTELKPEVIFIPAYYGDVGPMLKQAGDRWKDIPVVAGDGIDSPDLYKLMGSYTGEIYMSTHFAADDSNPKVQAFVKEYKGLYSKTPGAMAALGYDAALALHDALKRAGSADPAKLKKAINSISKLNGITGTISLDAERNAQKDVVILKVSPAGAKFYKRIAST
ncbi:MAG: ABC transporter substrate-binding protein, partial [Myxococcota bacterium]